MPKVTVLMSVYNGEKYLREAIDSILNQTFKDFESIIINDGSTDSSREIILSYNDPRIRLIDNEKNTGLTHSLNKGLQLAKGEYIARQDADDISLPERLERMTDFLDKNKDVELLGSSFINIDEKGKELSVSLLNTDDKEIKNMLLSGNHFGFEMFRKRVMEKVGFYREEFRYAQDYDLALRIAEVSKVANIKEPLYKYRITPNSISTVKRIEQDKYAELARELAREKKTKGSDWLDYMSKRQIRKLLPKLTLKDHLAQRRFISERHYKSAIKYLKNGKKKTFLKYIWKSIINNPSNYWAWVSLIENFTNRRLIKVLRTAKRNLM